MPQSVPLAMFDEPFFDWIEPELGYYPGIVHQDPSFQASVQYVEVDPVVARKKGAIEIQGKQVDLYLPDSDWDRLENDGELAVRVAEVESPVVIKAKLPEVRVNDAVAFLATRRVSMNGTTVQLKLDENDVHSLVHRGVAIAQNDDGELVRVTARQVPQTVMQTLATPNRQGINFLDLFLEMQKLYGKPNRVVFVNTFEQQWRLLGYSRGQLVSTFSLAPDEEVTLEIFTFDRSTTERTDDLTTELTRSTELNTNITTTLDVVHETAVTLQANAGVNGGIGLPAGELPVDLNGDVNADVGGEFQDNLNETINTVSDITLNIANNFRATRQVKVVQTRESGREERITRVVRNPNGSRTLILDNFEVLENFEVITQLLSHSEPALLVDCPELTFDEDFILAHKGFLQRNLVDPEYLSGIEAIDIVVANEIALEILTVPEAAIEEPADNTGTSGNSGEQIDTALKRYAKRLQEVVQELSSADHASFTDVYLELNVPNDPFSGFQEPTVAAKREFQKWLAWQIITVFYPTKHDALERYLREVTDGNVPSGSTPGSLINDDQKLVRELEFVSDSASSFAGSLAAFIRGTNPTLLWDVLGNIPAHKKTVIIGEMLSLRIVPNYLNLAATIENIDRQLVAFQAANPFEVVAITTGRDVDADLGNDGSNADVAFTELPYNLREFADAKTQVKALMAHLEEYDTYYHNRFWFEETPNARFERIQTTSSDLMSFIENRIIGFVGKQAVFPLRLGVDEAIDDLVGKMQEYVEKSRDQVGDVVDIQQITLPTDNVTMETRLGECEAYEPYLVDRRNIEKQLAQAQASLAQEQVLQQQLENERLRLRLDSGLLTNPFTDFDGDDDAESDPNADDFVDNGGG